MNIFLIPWTSARHYAVALVVGGFALVGWWAFLAWYVVEGPWWSRASEGLVWLDWMAFVVAFASLLTEGGLKRMPPFRRFIRAMFGGLLAVLFATVSWYLNGGIPTLFASEEGLLAMEDPSLVTLKFRLLQWVGAAWASALGPFLLRRNGLGGFFNHLFGGMTAGLVAAGLWQGLGQHQFGDLYLASGFAAFGWGTTHGLLVWGIPRSLYAGWIRVLSEHRFAHRIPVDKPDGSGAERFIGHFPRGMDVFLPADHGVAELHISALVDGEQTYRVRGLSQYPTLLRRPLVRIDLRYDPSRPAPLETELHSGDVLRLSDGTGVTEVEFVLLPREES